MTMNTSVSSHVTIHLTEDDFKQQERLLNVARLVGDLPCNFHIDAAVLSDDVLDILDTFIRFPETAQYHLRRRVQRESELEEQEAALVSSEPSQAHA